MRQRLDSTRTRIVASALEQVTEAGYAGCSIAAVGERAGVATGTIYRFFPSKGELFAEVFRQASAREVAAASAAGEAQREQGARAAILAAVHTFCMRALSAPQLAYALLAEPVDPLVDAERLVFHDAYTGLLSTIVRAGMANGELAQQHPRVTGAGIVGAVSDVLIMPLARGAADPAVVTALLTFVDRAIGHGGQQHGDA